MNDRKAQLSATLIGKGLAKEIGRWLRERDATTR